VSAANRRLSVFRWSGPPFFFHCPLSLPVFFFCIPLLSFFDLHGRFPPTGFKLPKVLQHLFGGMQPPFSLCFWTSMNGVFGFGWHLTFRFFFTENRFAFLVVLEMVKVYVTAAFLRAS